MILDFCPQIFSIVATVTVDKLYLHHLLESSLKQRRGTSSFLPWSRHQQAFKDALYTK